MVTVNDFRVSFDQPPIILNGGTLLPARAFAEELGATVEWDDELRTIIIEYEYKYY